MAEGQDAESRSTGKNQTRVEAACRECADGLELLRAKWRLKDRNEQAKKARQGLGPPPPTLPRSGGLSVYVVDIVDGVPQPLTREIKGARVALEKDLIPRVVPYVDREVVARLLRVLRMTDPEEVVADPEGKGDQPELRWQQEWHELGLEQEVTELALLLRVAGGAEDPEEPDTTPLTRREQVLLEILYDLPMGEGLTGPEILAMLPKRGVHGVSQSTLTTRLIRGLRNRRWPLENRGGCGYFLSSEERSRFSKLYKRSSGC